MIKELLGKYNIPDSIFESWKEYGIIDELPIQKEAIDNGLLEGENLIISAPTSSGKTFVGEIAAIIAALKNKKCIYLVPFKAIAEEKYYEFRKKYEKGSIGARIILSTGDNKNEDKNIYSGEFEIAILTYEKMLTLLVNNNNFLNFVGVVIIDEIQMIADENRGGTLELLLTRLKSYHNNLQIIGLSAVLSDINKFDEWLSCKLVHNDNRPVELKEGVLLPNGSYEFISWIGVERKNGTEIIHPYSGNDEQDKVSDLCSKLLYLNDEQIIVFVNTVAKTEQYASSIANKCGYLPVSKKAHNEIAELEESETQRNLLEVLNHSVGFHNANMSQEERNTIEQGFRSKEIRCIISTSTLSMGVNLPCKTVIIDSTVKWEADKRTGFPAEKPITVAEYRNMSGRAGRYKIDNYGRSILLVTGVLGSEGLLNIYVNGNTEKMRSCLYGSDLDKQLLHLYAARLCFSSDEASDFILNTYYGLLNLTTNQIREKIKSDVLKCTILFKELDLLSINSKKEVTITEKGNICAYRYHNPDSFSYFLEYVKCIENVDESDFVLTCLNTEDGDAKRNGIRLSTQEFRDLSIFYFHKLKEYINEGHGGPLTRTYVEEKEQKNLFNYDTTLRDKAHASILAYLAGIASNQIENKLHCRKGILKKFADNLIWISNTCALISRYIGKIQIAKSFEDLANRLQYGCSQEALNIAPLSRKLFRHEREKLIEAGFTTYQSIIDTDGLIIAKNAKISLKRIQKCQQTIIEAMGDDLEIEKRQVARLKSINKDTRHLEHLYTDLGTDLEYTIEDILSELMQCIVKRITSQKEGEADIHIIFSNGQSGIVGITAKDKSTDLVALKKAGDILQQSPNLNPEIFISIGRPDFHPDAIKKSDEHAISGKNYKTIPIKVIAEMYVRFIEKRVDSKWLEEFLINKMGHITVKTLDSIRD